MAIAERICVADWQDWGKEDRIALPNQSKARFKQISGCVDKVFDKVRDKGPAKVGPLNAYDAGAPRSWDKLYLISRKN